MRICELDLIAWGPFAGVRLGFDRGGDPGGLHVIYGPNEAGKTTTLRAVRALLHGVPVRTVDAHRHRMPKLRIGARLRNAAGAEIEIRRRKGKKQTLLDADERPIPEATLRDRFLGGVSAELFASMFGIDHDALRRGARALLEGGGEVGESLFDAGLGGPGVHRVLRELQAEAAQLYSRGAQKKPVNLALRELREARVRIRELALPPRRFAEASAELAATRQQLTRLGEQARGLRQERHRLERQRGLLPLLAKRRELVERLESLGAAAALDEADAGRRRDALRALREGGPRIEGLEREIAELEGELERLDAPGVLGEHEAVVRDLRDRAGSHRKASRDVPRLTRERRVLQEEACGILADLGWDRSAEASSPRRQGELFGAGGPPPDDGGADGGPDDLGPRPLAWHERASELRRDFLTGAPRHARIAELSRQLSVLAEQVRTSRRAAGRLDARRRRARAGLDALPEPASSAPLRAALARAQAEGDLERRLADGRRALAVLDDEVAAARAGLGLIEGDADDLARLAVPPLETVARFERELSAADVSRARLEERAGELHERLELARRRLAELRLGGEVPTEDELEAARGRRAVGWALVRRAWLDGDDEVVREESARYDDGRALPEAFAHAISAADGVADRLRREADRVARRAELVATEEAARRARDELAGRMDELASRRDATDAAWRDVWRDVGIARPLPPVEMRAWLGRLASLRDAVGRRRAAAAEVAGLEARVAELGAALAARLAALDPDGSTSPGPDGESLAERIDRAGRIAARLDGCARRRAELESSVEALDVEVAAERRARAEHEEALAEARARWAELLAPLGLCADATPAEADAVLGRCQDLFDRLGRCRELDRRLAGIERDAASFGEDVARVVAELAPDLTGLFPEQAAEQLHVRVTDAAAGEQRRERLRRELAGRRRAWQAAKTEHRLADETLEELRERAECARVEDLEEAFGRARAVRETRRELASLEESLLDLGGGATVADLVREGERLDADALGADLEAVDARLAEVAEEEAELQRTDGRRQAALAAMDGTSEAATAEAAASSIVAKLRSDVSRHVVARLAASLLGKAIERYRERHQGPVLRRASTLFRRLTLGAYARLGTGFDERDEPVLRCVRSDGASVGVDALSDGTRDQLYLALRLASVERHLDGGEPLPFIVDDVLIHFDDERARAALAAFGELAARTQVMIFTHHARIAELAREAVPADRLVEHDLGALRTGAPSAG